MSKWHARKVGGFTLVELLVVIAIIALLVGILLPALARARKNAAELKDGTQVRSLAQGLTTYAAGNRDRYPLPDDLDRADVTEDFMDDTWEKRRTGPIFSVLIFNNIVTPELCISTVEQGAQFSIYEEYKYELDEDDVAGDAAEASQALWDPGFKGTPNDGTEITGAMNNSPGDTPNAGFSYAHLIPAGAREANWRNDFSASVPVISTRGPFMDPAGSSGANNDGRNDPEDPIQIDVDASNTSLLLYGGQNEWAGNVGFQDNHVERINTVAPETVTFPAFGGTDENGRIWRDNLFHDDNIESTNPSVDVGNVNDSTRNIVMSMLGHGIDPASTTNTAFGGTGDATATNPYYGD
ncbi:MAG: type II secretion system protein [Planctomycetota bacterium]